MNLIELIKSRRTIRKFKQISINIDILIDIIDCARLAPCASNKQPLEYIIVTNKIYVMRYSSISDGQHIFTLTAYPNMMKNLHVTLQ